jgi:hypothetical protein
LLGEVPRHRFRYPLSLIDLPELRDLGVRRRREFASLDRQFGLVAGSLSMALGEYLSVQSARELFARARSMRDRAADDRGLLVAA